MKPPTRPINGKWWADYIREIVVPELETYEECVTGRMLRSFDSLHEELEKRQKERFESITLHEDEDPGPAAEWAAEEAFDRGSAIGAIYYGAIALFTAGLYHLFEQQGAHLAREGQRYQYSPKREGLEEWLESEGIRLGDFPGWSRIHTELRLVANVAKHAEGHSARTLRTVRQDLFTPPGLREAGELWEGVEVEKPLAGESVFITEAEFTSYAQMLREFWAWLAERLATLP
jgi:hypothetical protein